MKPKIDQIGLEALCAQVEQWMREGKGKEAAEALAGLSPSGLPRGLRLPIANLARRAGMIPFGLRVLAPLARPKARAPQSPATDRELAEYALLLDQAGSSSEAIAILEKLPAATLPEVSFYRAYCHMSQWEYAEAGPLLEAFLRFPEIDPYQRLVGAVNLAAVKVFAGELEPAEEILHRLIPEAMLGKYKRLLVNSLELLAQIDIQNAQFSRAQARIAEARQTLSDIMSSDSLYLEKWLCVIEALQTRSAVPLQRFREIAAAAHYFEGVRDADYYLLKITGDQALFGSLYYGTPYTSYRAHLRKSFDTTAPARLELGTGSRLLELETGEVNGGVVDDLRPGKKIHQLLALLFSDRYRPFRLGAVFSTLFPGEHFNLLSAPNRVHQLVSRARKVLETAGLSVRILEEDGLYRAELGPGTRIGLVASGGKVPNAQESQLARLRNQFGSAPFSAKAAREALGLSLATMHRLLRAGSEAGILQQLGQGRKTFYEFKGVESAAPAKAA